MIISASKLNKNPHFSLDVSNCNRDPWIPIVHSIADILHILLFSRAYLMHDLIFTTKH